MFLLTAFFLFDFQRKLVKFKLDSRRSQLTESQIGEKPSNTNLSRNFPLQNACVRRRRELYDEREGGAYLEDNYMS